MRVLFVPAAVTSHLLPMVPIAWAFRAAGHDVRVAGQPPLAAAIMQSGLTAVPVGGSYDLQEGIAGAAETLRRQTGYWPAAGTSAMPPDVQRRYAELRTLPHVRAAEAMATELADFARCWRPDLVVTDPITMVAPLVAGVAGAALVYHLWGPQPPSLAKFPGYGAPVERWPGALRVLYDSFGVAARDSHGIATIDPCPASLQPAAVPRRLAVRYLCYNGSGVVPEWLRRPPDRPRVCVSWMTTRTVPGDPEGGEGPGRTLPAIIEALAETGAELVVTMRQADLANLTPIPPGVHVAADLPLHLVLSACDAAVNHGGGGTVLTVACHGVPQVMMPQDPGQVFNVECVAAAGAGECLAANPVDPGDVAATVAAMLSEDSWRKAARRVEEENHAQPTPARLLERIEELI